MNADGFSLNGSCKLHWNSNENDCGRFVAENNDDYRAGMESKQGNLSRCIGWSVIDKLSQVLAVNLAQLVFVKLHSNLQT